jgi:hypothetical protein
VIPVGLAGASLTYGPGNSTDWEWITAAAEVVEKAMPTTLLLPGIGTIAPCRRLTTRVSGLCGWRLTVTIGRQLFFEVMQRIGGYEGFGAPSTAVWIAAKLGYAAARRLFRLIQGRARSAPGGLSVCVLGGDGLVGDQRAATVCPKPQPAESIRLVSLRGFSAHTAGEIISIDTVYATDRVRNHSRRPCRRLQCAEASSPITDYQPASMRYPQCIGSKDVIT